MQREVAPLSLKRFLQIIRHVFSVTYGPYWFTRAMAEFLISILTVPVFFLIFLLKTLFLPWVLIRPLVQKGGGSPFSFSHLWCKGRTLFQAELKILLKALQRRSDILGLLISRNSTTLDMELFTLFAFATSWSSGSQEIPISLGDVKKILFIKIDHIGDYLCSIPALRALRQRFPSAKITLVVGPWCQDLPVNNPYIDEWRIYYTNDKYFNFIGHRYPAGLLWRLRFFLRLQATKFDLVIDPSMSRYEHFKLSYLSAAKIRVGIHHHLDTWPSPYQQEIAVEYHNDYEPDRMLKILAPLGTDTSNRRLEYWVSESDKSFARDFLRNHNLPPDTLLIGMAPAARWIYRMWGVENFAHAANALQTEYGGKIVLIGSAAERPILEEVKNRMHSEPIVVAGSVDLNKLAALMQHLNLFIANDGGLMHLAVALGVPTVALFGPGDHIRWGPRSDSSTVLRGEVPCSPCAQTVCPYDGRCLRLINAPQVIKAARMAIEVNRKASVTTQQNIYDVSWWHCITLPDGSETPGKLYSHGRDTERYCLPEDLTGKNVLDVGCSDGYWSFEAEKRGAKFVLGIDVSGGVEGHNDAMPPQFELAKKLIGSKAEYLELSVYNVDELRRKYPGVLFDVVLFNGVLYHLKHPLYALEQLYKVMAPGGLLIVETAVLFSAMDIAASMSWKPIMWFCEDEWDGDSTNWSYPNNACVMAWLRSCGFKKVELKAEKFHRSTFYAWK
jgi:heptosyltransferase-2